MTMQGLMEIDLKKLGMPNLVNFRSGKVRDSVEIEGEDFVIFVSTDRLSSFDVRYKRPIAYKGACLNAQSNFWFSTFEDIIGNWVISNPHPMVSIGKKLKMMPYEDVRRRVMLGSLWEKYQKGNRGEQYGLTLAENLREFGSFDGGDFKEWIFTPTTKSDEHDEDISRSDLVKLAMRSGFSNKQIEDAIYFGDKIFKRMAEIAKEAGFMFADGKCEFGIDTYTAHLYMGDEIGTCDASRFYEWNNYFDYFNGNTTTRPAEMSKEFFRKAFKDAGWQKGMAELPILTDMQHLEGSRIYQDFTKRLTGKSPHVDYNLNEAQFEDQIIGAISDELKQLRS